MKWLLTSGQRSVVRDLIWGPGAAPRLWVWHPWAKIKGALDVGGNELVNVVPPWDGPVSPSCPDVPVLMSPSCPDVTCRWLQSPSPQLIGWTVFHQEETQSYLFQFSVDLFTRWLVHSFTRWPVSSRSLYVRMMTRPLTFSFCCVLPADERDRVQKKTFTKWVNKHLIKVGVSVSLQSGHVMTFDLWNGRGSLDICRRKANRRCDVCPGWVNVLTLSLRADQIIKYKMH